MNHRRAAASGLLAVLAVGAIAGCGGDDPAATPEPTTAPTQGTTTSSTAGATPGIPAPEDGGAEAAPGTDDAGGASTGSAGSPAGGATGDAVQPTLTYAGPVASGGYELAGVVPGVVEDGGLCTFQLTSGSTVVQREQEGLADATSTSCGSVELSGADLRSGTWEAVLRYDGPAGGGASEVATVVVP